MTDKLIKTGDYVVALTDGGFMGDHFFVGKTYVVASDQRDTFTGINVISEHGVPMYMFTSEVELVEESTEKGTFLVAKVDHRGIPKFASAPVAHRTRALAEAEMVRLTELHRGTFRVYKAVAEAHMPEPVEPKMSFKKLD
jgi:hypothetical protein